MLYHWEIHRRPGRRPGRADFGPPHPDRGGAVGVPAVQRQLHRRAGGTRRALCPRCRRNPRRPAAWSWAARPWCCPGGGKPPAVPAADRHGPAQLLAGLPEQPFPARGETCPGAAELMGRLAERRPLPAGPAARWCSLCCASWPTPTAPRRPCLPWRPPPSRTSAPTTPAFMASRS